MREKRKQNGAISDWLYRRLCGRYAPESRAARERCGLVVSVMGILLNLLLFAGKFLVGVLIGSVSIRADAINNLSDAGSSVISCVIFRISAKPADRKHPYGHARIEYVASMIVSFFVMLIGVEMFKESVGKLITPYQTVFSTVSMIVLALSVLVKLLLALLNRGIGKRIQSDVMKATAVDSLSDAAATSGVLLCAVIARITGFDADAYMGILVAVIILIAGVKILAETKDHILGTQPDSALVESIKAIVHQYPGALGIHDLYIHNYGPGRSVASMHIEVDGSADVYESHDMIDNIEKKIAAELGMICTIHMDPIVTDDGRVNALRCMVLDQVRLIDPRLNIHDFRVVEGQTHSNLIFDVEAPFERKMSNEELEEAVKAAVAELSPSYYAVTQIDRK